VLHSRAVVMIGYCNMIVILSLIVWLACFFITNKMKLVQAVYVQTNSSIPYCKCVWQVSLRYSERQLEGTDIMISSLNK
jgi:hypothetical protein